MRFKILAVAGLLSVLSAAPAFAFGGGGGHAQATYTGGGAISGAFDGGTFVGQCSQNGSCRHRLRP